MGMLIDYTQVNDMECIFFMLCVFQKALHVRALRTFKDDFGTTRKSGEEWLITFKDSETHIPQVYEEVRIKECVFSCNIECDASALGSVTNWYLKM